MKRSKVGIIAASLLILVALGFFLAKSEKTVQETQTAQQPVQTVQAPQTAPETPTEELFRLTNEERSKIDAKALVLDAELNKSAQLKADEMEQTGVFNHVSPSGKDGWTYINDVGEKCTRTAENLAGDVHIYGPQTTINSWLGSKQGHREALLDPDWEEVGFGVSRHYIVQHFCDID